MADIADAMDAIYGFVLPAVYPNGTSSPSVTGNPITVGEGWPLAEDIDAAMKSTPPRALVTIFAPGVTANPVQVLDSWGVIAYPVHGLTTATNSDGSVTISGTPVVGEYVTFVLDHKVAYSVAAVAGDTAATMAAKIAAAVAVGYAGTAAIGATVTVVGYHALTVRIGAPATLGQKVWRQREEIIVTVWASDPAVRTQIAKPVDLALKNNLTFNFADTSRAILTYSRTLTVDRQMKLGEYRRDLVYFCQFDTVNTIPAYEVTSFEITLDPGFGTASSPSSAAYSFQADDEASVNDLSGLDIVTEAGIPLVTEFGDPLLVA